MKAEHLRRGVFVGAAAALLLPASAWAGARPGARYEGKVSDGTRSQITVGRTGRRLHSYDLYSQATCSDGTRHEIGLLDPGERPTPIRADGSFSYRERPYVFRLQKRKYRHPYRVRQVTTFSGHFDASGDVVVGNIRTTYGNRRFHCDTGNDSFTFYRQGTPQAPYRTKDIASGRYRVGEGPVRGWIRTTAFGPTLPSVKLNYPIRCGRRWIRIVVTPLRPYLHGRRFSSESVGTYNERGGVRIRARDRLRGEFHYLLGYRVTGRVTTRQVVYHHRRRLGVCRGTWRFEGSFRTGPVGPEGETPGH